MPRNAVRVFLVLLLIGLAVFVPLIVSGYSELSKATFSSSYVEAAQHYQNAALRIPWRGDLYELAGHYYYYAKEYVKADAAYQKAYAHIKLSAEGWVAWGDVNYLNDNPERAVEIWEQALDREHPSTHLYSRLAEIYQSKGELAKAAEYLQQYISSNSEDALAHYRLGLLLTISDPQRAFSELEIASQLDPELDPAAETLRDALNLALQYPSASTRSVILGRGLGLVNEWKLARVAFESAVEIDAKNAEAWAWLGEANQQTGLAHGGDDTELEKALELNPNSSTVRGLRGLYFQRSGNFRQALTEFQAAAQLEPKNPAWLISVGESYSKNGDLIQALQSYQAATTLAPEIPGYWRLLAIFCGQNNVNIKDIGVPAARQAVILANNDANSLDVLGWLLILDADYDGAERMLKRAWERDAQNPSVHLHLGMLYLQTNHRASAYDHLTRARDLGNTDAEAILKQYFR
jgi:tetratricopeptide (TPR) repeat protein